MQGIEAVRKQGHWMVQLDDRILEVVAGEGPIRRYPVRDALAASGEGLDYPADYVSHRLRRLRTRALLVEDGDGKYRLTDRGRGYLTGTYDAETAESGASRADDPR